MKNLSRFLSLVLRHKPEEIGIKLDQNGWVDIDVLIEALNKNGGNVTRNSINKIVQTDNKNRYSIQDKKIRANQGHSVKVDLQLSSAQPPRFLYHGTPSKFVQVIMEQGLKKMKRHHVHLSSDTKTATQVGARRGEAVILLVDALGMFNDGYDFFYSENGVWLTDHVPSEYLGIQAI